MADTETKIISKTETVAVIECEYQTVKKDNKVQDKKEIKEVLKTEITHSEDVSTNYLDDLIKKIAPAKSFLYRNQNRSDNEKTYYLPMVNVERKKKKQRFSTEYPFDWRKFRFSKFENCLDRGYYHVNNKIMEKDPKEKCDININEIDIKEIDEHFYEDPSDIKVKNKKKIDIREKIKVLKMKMPFSKKSQKIEEDEGSHINYENNLYDTIVLNHDNAPKPELEPIQDTEYTNLKPINLHNDYCDVRYHRKKETFFSFILSLFSFGTRESLETKISGKNNDTSQKWCDRKSKNMADRPLPVPVDNESYFMKIDRQIAEDMLMGEPDGTFILRPSSQPDHVYTLSVACSNNVHNVGIRKRPDGKLALGFARRGERCFNTIPELIAFHRQHRLLLVAGAGIIGTTALSQPPVYYGTPSNIPVDVKL